MMRPAPAPLPEHVATSKNFAGTNLPSMAPAQRRIFHYDPGVIASPLPAATYSFTPDAPPSIGFEGSRDGILDANRLGTLTIRTQPPPPKPLAHTNAPSAPIRVGGSVQMAKLIRKVIPAYPALARTARISGVVHLIGMIAKDGTIRDLQLVDGHPLLARAAMEAVEQWIYKPTLLNGEPVEVIAPIEVSFTLGP
jgi:protein TonB